MRSEAPRATLNLRTTTKRSCMANRILLRCEAKGSISIFWARTYQKMFWYTKKKTKRFSAASVKAGPKNILLSGHGERMQRQIVTWKLTTRLANLWLLNRYVKT